MNTTNVNLHRAGVAMEVLEDVSEYIAQLVAEVEKHKKNSERYEWLKSQKSLDLRTDGSRWTDPAGQPFTSSHRLCAGDTSFGAYRTLNEVIDTAMEKEQQ